MVPPVSAVEVGVPLSTRKKPVSPESGAVRSDRKVDGPKFCQLLLLAALLWSTWNGPWRPNHWTVTRSWVRLIDVITGCTLNPPGTGTGGFTIRVVLSAAVTTRHDRISAIPVTNQARAG